ncbi:MAG TPA: hypothetical protein VJ385_01370 [Fibrobacteria bacterium]|nr:hypothetical protein [Fibrobacteria bacterium]
MIPAFFLGLGLVSHAAGKAQRAPLFKSSGSAAAEAPDTLEVYCIYVQFKSELENGTDDPSTTGFGVFGSAGKSSGDPDKNQDYTLDPNGNLRSYRFYLEKHFEFARNYFEKVSNGRVTIRQRIFPAPDGSGKITPFTLPNRMKFYNPSELDRDSKQKISDFNEERGQHLMAFVTDAIKSADSEKPADNPFKAALDDSLKDPLNKRKHRCYLLFHAGHSRLLDGGQLGAFGANTPNDFTDFFVTKDDFSLLDSATKTYRKGGEPDPVRRALSKGVRVSTGDTVDNVMMLSEAASQDKVNWGINGILINQLARQMGMPDMFDVVKGISQLGFFDLMDFAGYNTMNGFLPVYPSAWVRAYMGWDEPVTAKAGNGPYSEYQVWSPASRRDGGRPTTIKIPINDREYFLVENRQRAAGDSTVTIYYDEQANSGDLTFSKSGSKTVPFSKVDSIFLDSIPDPVAIKADPKSKKRIANPDKPAGIITGASSYDLGLPSSGLLVWHVNEWFISQFLKEGAVNAYLGDTLKSQYKGLELVEADGSLSIGKEFKDQLGQPAFDYGSGSDMLPHVRVKRVNPPKDTSWSKTRDTLDMIGPYGAANTNAWNDGRTHLRLEALVPDKALLDKGMSSFSGDSIYNVRDSVLTLRVHWPDNNTVKQAPAWSWPAKLDPGGHPQSVNVLKSPGGGKYVVAVSDRGYAQTFTSEGVSAMDPDTTLKGKAGYDSVTTLLPSGLTRDTSTIPVTSLAGKLGSPLGSATLGDSVLAVLTADKIIFLKLRPAGLAVRSRDSSAVSVSADVQGQAGPVAAGDRFWVLTRDHRAKSFSADGAPLDDVALPDLEYQALAAFPAGGNKPMNLAAAARGGQAVLLDPEAGTAARLDNAWGDRQPAADEAFTVAAADFDRDGKVDLFLLGSKGAATLIGLDQAPKARVFAGFPQRFQRSVHFVDTVYETKNGTRTISRVLDFHSDDASGPALADLDGDRHPDILFSASNSVFAIDYRGAVLPGWPFLLEERQNVGFAYGNPRRPETAVRTTPLALALDGHATVLIGSPDGLILAVDSLGRKLRASSFQAAQNRRGGILASDVADWPLTMGGLTLDSNDNPYIHLSASDLDGDGDLELLAQSGTGSLNVWTLKKGSASAGQAWVQPGGSAGRQNFLDVSAWQTAATPGSAETIEEFHLFPSPVRGPTATLHLRLGSAAKKARIRVYDVAGAVVKDQSWENLAEGLQAFNQVLDLQKLAPDVYSAQVEVWFPGGKQKKWQRFGVIR